MPTRERLQDIADNFGQPDSSLGKMLPFVSVDEPACPERYDRLTLSEFLQGLDAGLKRRFIEKTCGLLRLPQVRRWRTGVTDPAEYQVLIVGWDAHNRFAGFRTTQTEDD